MEGSGLRHQNVTTVQFKVDWKILKKESTRENHTWLIECVAVSLEEVECGGRGC